MCLTRNKRARSTPCHQHAFSAPRRGRKRRKRVRFQSSPSSGSLLKQPHARFPLPRCEDNNGFLPTGKAGRRLLPRRCANAVGNGRQKKSRFHSTSRFTRCCHHPLEKRWKSTYVLRSRSDSSKTNSLIKICATQGVVDPLNALFAKRSRFEVKTGMFPGRG